MLITVNSARCPLTRPPAVTSGLRIAPPPSRRAVSDAGTSEEQDHHFVLLAQGASQRFNVEVDALHATSSYGQSTPCWTEAGEAPWEDPRGFADWHSDHAAPNG